MKIYYFWHEEDGRRRFFTSMRRAKQARRSQEEEAGYYVGPLEESYATELLDNIERRNQDLEHAVLALSRLMRSLGEKLPSYLEETIRSVEDDLDYYDPDAFDDEDGDASSAYRDLMH